MRIVSLLPSATEMICALGLRAQLVGVSHECDYPLDVATLPRVTRTKIAHTASSLDIDQQVRQELAAQSALYSLDEARLVALRPDLLVTQSLCDVCAVAADEVTAVACRLPAAPMVFNLQPLCLSDIFASITALGVAADAVAAAQALHAGLTARLDAIRARSTQISMAARPRVAMLEWLHPLFDAGHWNPELVDLAGGLPVLGRAGQPSRTLAWEALRAADPDVIFIACCGFDIQRTVHDVTLLASHREWGDLRAVRAGRVWVADGNAYFNRPGPRILDSLEVLAHCLHPAVHPRGDATPAIQIRSK